MDTTQKTNTYPSPFGASGNVLASPPASAGALPSVAAGQHFLTAADICELIDAAGPLTVDDLAAGLRVGSRETRALVGWLERNGDLRQDEWGRFALAGTCRSQHAA
jgi:hypothetical protein